MNFALYFYVVMFAFLTMLIIGSGMISWSLANEMWRRLKRRQFRTVWTLDQKPILPNMSWPLIMTGLALMSFMMVVGAKDLYKIGHMTPTELQQDFTRFMWERVTQ